jgi:hypothetical protein
MSMDMTIQGDIDVIRALERLETRVQSRIVEAAGRAALKPVTATARARVPKDTGTLKQSIGVKKVKRLPRGLIVLSVGPRFGYAYQDAAGKKHDPFYYGIPVEYGHVIKLKGVVVGQIAPAGFLRAAYEAHRLTIVDDFSREMRERIEVEMAKS